MPEQPFTDNAQSAGPAAPVPYLPLQSFPDLRSRLPVTVFNQIYNALVATGSVVSLIEGAISNRYREAGLVKYG